MTDSFDKSKIDPPSVSNPAAGRCDKLQEAGMATRFVKGTPGNPNGRPKRRPVGMSLKELAERFRELSGRA
jgi:hypothetical protein